MGWVEPWAPGPLQLPKGPPALLPGPGQGPGAPFPGSLCVLMGSREYGARTEHLSLGPAGGEAGAWLGMWTCGPRTGPSIGGSVSSTDRMESEGPALCYVLARSS